MKKWMIVCACCACILAAGAGCALYLSLPAVVINGVPVCTEEVVAAQNQNRAVVASRLQRDYGMEYTDGFWSQPVADSSAQEILNDAALETLTRTVVTEELLRGADLLPYTNYKELTEQWQDDTLARKQKTARGEVVYGPVEYPLEEYRQYILSNALVALEEAYCEQWRTELTDDDIAAFLRRHPEVKPVRYPTVEVTLYRASESESGLSSQQLEQTGEELAASLRKGEEVNPEYWTQEQTVFSEETKHQELLARQELFYAVMQQPQPDQVVGPLYCNGSWYTAKVTKVQQEDDQENREWYLQKYCQYLIEEQIRDGAADAEIRRVRAFPAQQE